MLPVSTPFASRFLTQDPRTLEILDLLSMVADSDATVLLTGESGTGKELLARGIHDASSRRDAAYVTLNCGAVPPALVESELFGHERGAFTNAYQRRVGRAANAFALLGYDTGRLIVEGLNGVEGNTAGKTKLTEAFATATFRSPRGHVAMDSRTHGLSNPVYLRKVQMHGGAPRNVAVAELELVSEFDERVEPMQTKQDSGFLAAYPCI